MVEPKFQFEGDEGLYFGALYGKLTTVMSKIRQYNEMVYGDPQGMKTKQPKSIEHMINHYNAQRESMSGKTPLSPRRRGTVASRRATL